jgi:hypothetical protein
VCVCVCLCWETPVVVNASSQAAVGVKFKVKCQPFHLQQSFPSFQDMVTMANPLLQIGLSSSWTMSLCCSLLSSVQGGKQTWVNDLNSMGLYLHHQSSVISVITWLFPREPQNWISWRRWCRVCTCSPNSESSRHPWCLEPSMLLAHALT